MRVHRASSLFINFINIENSCDFKQHAINDFNTKSHKYKSWEVNEKKTIRVQNEIGGEKWNKENDERGERKGSKKKLSFCCKKCIEFVVGVIISYFFSFNFLAVDGSHLLIVVGWIQNQKL